MSRAARRLFGVVIVLGSLLFALGGQTGASVSRGESTTFTGTFEFEGIAAVSGGKRCHGEGAFGVMKPRAKVRISERVASGDFETLARGRIKAGKSTGSGADRICRMPFTVRAATTPADDSRIYLEVKGVAFDISWPAADVTDGDLGTWRCEFSDDACAEIVGET